MFELTIILSLAAFLSIIFRFIKQPPILAYMLAGIILGPFGNLQLQSKDFLQTLGELGIAFLLFMIGLELKFSDLKSVGRVAITVGVFQIVLTFLGGLFLSLYLGFTQLTSVYLGLAVSLSSTIIVVKLLSDKKDLQSLYGKISLGILLIQDLFAVIILVLLSTGGSWESIPPAFLKGFVIFGTVLFLSGKIFPKILDRIAKSSETLFLFSIAWALSLSALVSAIGFSIEIGGLLAGLALANTSENFQIIAKTRSLRDFFVTIFFVFLGMSMGFSDFPKIILPAIFLSLLVLVLKPLIVAIVMEVLGYRKRTSFLTGLSLAQISEFSLIIIFLGVRLGQISSDIISLLTLVAIFTFALSNYMILGSSALYKNILSKFPLIERSSKFEDDIGENLEHKDHVILVGADRTGGSVLNALISSGEKVLVIDSNPDVIRKLKNRKVKSLFGDISDLEIQERAGLKNAKLIISTVSDTDDNMFFISEIKKLRKRPKVVTIARDDREEEELKKAGANYVIQPHVLGGRHLAHLIKTNSLF